MSKELKQLLCVAYKEWINGSMATDTLMKLNNNGYDPGFLVVLFEAGWTAARMIRTEKQ